MVLHSRTSPNISKDHHLHGYSGLGHLRKSSLSKRIISAWFHIVHGKRNKERRNSYIPLLKLRSLVRLRCNSQVARTTSLRLHEGSLCSVAKDTSLWCVERNRWKEVKREVIVVVVGHVEVWSRVNNYMNQVVWISYDSALWLQAGAVNGVT